MLPRKIVLFWSQKKLPEIAEKNLQAWRKHYPDYTITLFDAEAAGRYLQNNKTALPADTGAQLVSMYHRARLPAMQADIFRTVYAYVEGGLYADLTIHPLKSLEDIVDQDADIVLTRRGHGRIVNGLFWAARQSRFLRQVIIRISANTLENQRNNVWLATGPSNWLAVAEQWKQEGKTGLQAIDDTTLRKRYFRYRSTNRGETQKTHWSNLQKNCCFYRDYIGGPRRLVFLVSERETFAKAVGKAVAHEAQVAFHQSPDAGATVSALSTSFKELDTALSRQSERWGNTDDFRGVFAGPLYQELQRQVAEFMTDTTADTVIVAHPLLTGLGFDELLIGRQSDGHMPIPVFWRILVSVFWEHDIEILFAKEPGHEAETDYGAKLDIIERDLAYAHRVKLRVTDERSIADDQFR